MPRTSHKGKADTAWLFFAYPTILALMLLIAGCGYTFVFQYNPGGAVYRIAAMGYGIKGQKVVYGLTFLYDKPESWISPIDDLPLLLLGHFIVGIVLALYVAVRLWVHRRIRHGTPMDGACKCLAASAYLLATVCLALPLLDAGKQVEAQIKFGRKLLTFDAYGWFLVVCGPLVAVMWGAHGVSVWGFIVGSKKVTLG